ncbi:Thioesterase/thiol ester dehydrase-isomerase [Mytilinidion resinicola]|uniref:Thioesterase/thiol ester dehydrase-isomerase n=1 Tax=Mytilinidion resinicola TaxID=574789 RepID=A0A6A6Z4J8_9PEZI|nr:Thioesterase/thiol ester dehydrase-isomerase [Mytilinidion resinicola]KAF2815950.1 Thioesterase/thiol ester dehydrase-isomerase [Mytilinidion resinicola]
MPTEYFEDFETHPWVQTLLSDSTIIQSPLSNRAPGPAEGVSNSLFAATLHTKRAVRAYLSCSRPDPNASSSNTETPVQENYIIVSVGDGLDGASGRLHGGFLAALLDQVMGACAVTCKNMGSSPATKEMYVRFRKPVATPGVILARAKVEKVEGKRTWVKGWVEDGMGTVYAEGEATFVRVGEVGKL